MPTVSTNKKDEFKLDPDMLEAEFSGWKMKEYVAPGPFRVRLVRTGGTSKRAREYRALIHMGGGENWAPLRKDFMSAEQLVIMKAALEVEFKKQEKDWRKA